MVLGAMMSYAPRVINKAVDFLGRDFYTKLGSRYKPVVQKEQGGWQTIKDGFNTI